MALTETHWFADHQQLQDLLTHQKVFIAPRLAEGIGMSFLEAMAMGCAVIAQDDATMNEYIVHGKTGILVDWSKDNTGARTRFDLESLGIQARKFIEDGFTRYQDELVALVANWQILFSEPRKSTFSGAVAALLHGFRHRVLRPLKLILRRRSS